MKSDSINFRTTKSIHECANVLREAVSTLKAQMNKIDDDLLGGIGRTEPAISVVLSGKNRWGFGPRGWAVQVYVTDLGNARLVELVALDDGVIVKMSGGDFFDLGLGKKQRSKIKDMLS